MISKNIIDVLYAARNAGVEVLLADGKLRVKVPKGDVTDSTLLDQIKNFKEEIIGFLSDSSLQSEITNTENSLKALAHVARLDRIALSYSQERLWFIDELEGSSAYHISSLFSLEGIVDDAALERSFRDIVFRHESLRTVIRSEGGVPYQEFLPGQDWCLNCIELEDGVSVDVQVRRIAEEDFDLSKDYMVRAHLLRKNGRCDKLLVTFHHIASDAWSLPILVRELEALYNGYVSGHGVTLPPLAVQYADYAHWQRAELKGERLTGKLSYWKSQLEGVEPLHLPSDYVRTGVLGTHGALLQYSLDSSLHEKLQALSRSHGVTLFMTMLSAFKVLLYRYSGQTDICVGSAVANRSHPELEGLIGFFTNTLALRSKLKAEDSFEHLLEQVRVITIGGYQHQDVPFEKVVDAVIQERVSSHSPVFQVMFDLQDVSGHDNQEIHLSGLVLKGERLAHQTSKFELTYSVMQQGPDLSLNIEYNTDLYQESTIRRMACHYQELLLAIVSAPQTAIGRLGILSSRDEEVLVNGFNNTLRAIPLQQSLVDLFTRQAIIHSEDQAVVADSGSLSYGELDKKSNQLARYLQKKGVTRESLVPLCISPGVDMLISLLGILKAGGAYVPISPDYPAERVKYILSDTGSSVMLSRNEHRFLLSEFETVLDILYLDACQSALAHEPEGALSEAPFPENLAYIIYTSGSTGTPKGVMVEHKSVVNYLLGEASSYIIEGESTSGGTFMHLSYTFDASVTALFMPLVHGKTLVISSKGANEVFQDALFVKHMPYDFIKLTPSHLPFLESAMSGLAGAKVAQRLVIGGEALQWKQLEWLIANKVEIEIINEYGPTEATVGCTIHRFKASEETTDRMESSSVSIGRPIDNSRIYILDSNEQLCPIGVYGELMIAGSCLSRGYLHNEELSLSRFTELKLKGRSERVYRTGDVACWLADGTLRYRGRNDDQVKIRGYRVELKEIESVLLQSGQVEAAVVLLREDEQGHRRLSGYVVASGVFSKENLQVYLRSHLPDYMVPAFLIEVSEIPLTPHGKADHKKLLSMESGETKAKVYEAPGNPFEIALAAIWEDLLGLEQVGVHDNFFELGGDSIITIQVVSRARRAGYDFQVGDIFEYQTIASLNNYLSQAATLAISSEEGELSGQSGLLPIQRWYLEREHHDISYFNQSILLGIDKELVSSDIEKAFKSLLSYHDALRYKYLQGDSGWEQWYGDYWRGVIVEDLTNESPSGLSQSITERCHVYQQSLDIEKGDVVRAVLIQTPGFESRNRLFLAIHHLVVDGVSWRILLEDLQMLLSGIKKHEAVSLGAKSSSYRQWYEGVSAYGKSEELQQQVEYWQQVSHRYQSLPVDKEYHGGIAVKDTDYHLVSLSSARTRSLLQDVPGVYHTEVNDLLLGALSMTLQQWSGLEGIVIGMEGHGREAIAPGLDISRTVGWFTSMYPVWLPTGSNWEVSDWIKSTKEQLRKVPSKGIGYGVLKYINRQAGLQGSSPWDVLFNYLGQVDNIARQGTLLSRAVESAGSDLSKEYRGDEKHTLISMVREGSLTIEWHYSIHHYNKATIISLAEAYIKNLDLLIAHCLERSKTGPVYTPSDYGLTSGVDYRELDRFLESTDPLLGGRRGDHIESIYRLSSLQEGMLFHGLYDEQGGAYSEQLAMNLMDVNIDLFLQSWQYVLRSRSTFRTAFYHDAFELPVQCVYKEVDLPVEIEDYSHLSERQQQLKIQEYESGDRLKKFSFKEAPLMRLSLLRLSDNHYRVLWTHHHIILDGWSLPVVMGELLSNYERLLKGEEVITSAEDRYEDYIRHIEGRDKNEEKHYWQQYLKEVASGSVLPFISGSKSRNKGHGEYKEKVLLLKGDIARKIEDYVQGQHITINTLMQGVWAYLLSCYTGSRDVIYGVTVSGRPERLSGVEQRVGMYINTLPLYTRVNEEAGVGQWLQTLQQEQIRSREYQYSSLSDIQRWLNIKGDLFDSLLVFENYPVSKVLSSQPWSLQVEDMHMREQTNYPFTLVIVAGEEVEIRMGYNSDLLEDIYVEQISGHFQQVLLDMLSDGARKISELELLTPEERYQLLEVFNDTQVAYPREKTLVELFREQVKRSPESIAVVYQQQELSYQELEARSNQLAHYLIGKGVGLESLVPVCLDRSIEMIVALLGIIKSGGAYVPIDPEYPQERIRYMLEDSRASFVISSSHLLEKLSSSTEIFIIELDTHHHQISVLSSKAPEVNLGPGNLAYVIYTSGSTGKPKGVMIEHKAVVNFIISMSQKLNFTDTSSLLSVTTYSFDIFNLELYLPLLFGGRMIMMNVEDTRDGMRLREHLASFEPTHMQATPSTWQMLIYYEWQNQEKVKILIGGEAVNENLKEALTGIGEVYNLYGPTETTIWSTIEKLEQGRSVLIGKPIANTSIYMLTPSGKVAPIGVPAELHIGGDGLARGYLNQETLTYERFVQNSFISQTEAKIYKTGDIARWLPNGKMEYMGRLDDQVKIHGYRIELGEIETVLLASDMVSQAIVIAKKQHNGNRRLIAYVVATTSFNRKNLNAFLQSKLPMYMVPFIIELQTLPLTPNGKIDKKSLPDPDIIIKTESVSLPGNEVEERIAQIWSEVLEISKESIGLETNFFDIGGNSILIIRAQFLLNRAFDHNISVALLFELPTVRALAGYFSPTNEAEEDNLHDRLQESLFTMEDTLKLLD